MPKIINRQEKKELILQAALKVFSEKGFNATKMIDIANQAGIGKGTIYEYFKNKEDILSELFAFLFRDFDQQFRKALETTVHPVAKLKLIVQIYFVDIFRQFENFTKVVMDFWMAEMHSEKNSDNNIHSRLYEMYVKYISLISEIIREGIDQKIFRPVNTEHYAAMLIAIFDGLFLQFFMDINKSRIDDLANSIVDMYLTSLTV